MLLLGKFSSGMFRGQQLLWMLRHQASLFLMWIGLLLLNLQRLRYIVRGLLSCLKDVLRRFTSVMLLLLLLHHLLLLLLLMLLVNLELELLLVLVLLLLLVLLHLQLMLVIVLVVLVLLLVSLGGVLHLLLLLLLLLWVVGQQHNHIVLGGRPLLLVEAGGAHVPAGRWVGIRKEELALGGDWLLLLVGGARCVLRASRINLLILLSGWVVRSAVELIWAVSHS